MDFIKKTQKIMAKVSFIVPVYNCAGYLRQCLDSLINQTFGDIEIICVDDCSTDNSRSVLEEYQQRDKRIILDFLEKNSGAGMARNRAIDLASGEYLRMVDGDDFIPEKSTEQMLHCAEESGCNFIRGGMLKYSGKNFDKITRGGRFPEKTQVNLSMKKDAELWYFDQHFTYLFNAAIVKEKAGARYNKNMRNGEDVAFMLQLIPHMETVTLLDQPVYCYRITPNSTVRGKKEEQYFYNLFALYDMEYGQLASVGFKEQVEHYMFWRLTSVIPKTIFPEMAKELGEVEMISVLNYLREIIDRYSIQSLCFTKRYSWQDLQAIPAITKSVFLLLSQGYVQEAAEVILAYQESRSVSTELKISNKRCKRLEKEVAGIKASRTWKIGAPARTFGRTLKKLRSKD